MEIMKRLKFTDELVELVLNGNKYATWRVDDEKQIVEGDVLSLCRNDGVEFAKVKVKSVKITMYGELTDNDWDGHEKFSSEKEMYETYSKYYKKQITPKTKLKVIKFKVIEK